MRTHALFGPEAEARIVEAVRRAEAVSRGQIVPMVVEKSDPYPEARYRGALLAGALATAVVLALRLPLHLGELPIVQLAAGLLGALGATWDPIERCLAGRRALAQAAHARAVRAFQEQGLHRTAEGTGVLIFASLFERQVVVLGDKGIHEKMGDDWEKVVEALASGLRRGDPAGGFINAIAVCGARLAAHFPRGEFEGRPVNELEDTLRRG